MAVPRPNNIHLPIRKPLVSDKGFLFAIIVSIQMKKMIHFLLCLLILSVSFFLPTPVHAQSNWEGTICVSEGGGPGTGDVATIQGLQCLVGNVLTVAIRVIGLAGFVMLIYASFRLLMAGSNSKATESAKNTLTFAIFGLVVALSAVIILNLIAAFTGVDIIKQFVIPGP